MKKSETAEILDQIENWLDYVSDIFIDIKDEWVDNEIIKRYESATQEFSCNHCGKCCNCEDFAIDCYASDIEVWLQEERYDILCSLTPILDEENIITFGFQSQRLFDETINEILTSNSYDQKIKNSFKKIRDVVHALNPGYNKNSSYCIFYNPKEKKHCMIYETLPYSCQAYPFDHSNFTDMKIPEDLSDKYVFEDDLIEDVPLCPKECYSNGNINEKSKCSEDEMYAVLLDRINYLVTTILEPDANDGIVELLVEGFANYIKFPKKKSSKKISTKSSKNSSVNNIRKDKNQEQTYKMSFSANNKNKAKKRKKS